MRKVFVLVVVAGLASARLGADSPSAIEGVVIDAAGDPVEGARVAAISTSPGADPSPVSRAISGGAGRFRVEGMPAGPYALTATSPKRAAAYLPGLVTKPGETLSGIRLRFEPAGFTISGSIRDARGRPLARPRVVVWRISQDEGDSFEVVGDERGRYAITLSKGQYVIRPEIDGMARDTKPRQLSSDRTVDFDLDSLADVRRPAPAEVVSWIRTHSVAPRTVEAGHGLADLRPLGAIVGKARVVALGEATHGTREFFQMKHRILEYLATELGFEVFAIEANWPESLAVNDYVVHGIGDPEKALSGMYFWTWDTQEVLDMIRWMRRFNENPRHQKKLKFYGFDMQTPTVAVQRTIEYLQRVDPEGADEASRLLAPLAAKDAQRTYGKGSPSVQGATADGIAKLLERFAQKKPSYTSLSSASAWAVAEHHLRIVRQAEENLRSTAGVRDRFMAENALWLLDQEPRGARMVVWAHNGHVSFSEDRAEKPMGAWLKEALGRDLVTLGFAFQKGSFQAIDLKNQRGLVQFTVPSAPEGSLEAAFARTGLPLAILDLRSLPARGAVADWWSSRHLTRSIGAVYDAEQADSYFFREAAPRCYDGLVFFESTTTAQPNPSGLRPPPARSN